jgi:hypothetical protein
MACFPKIASYFDFCFSLETFGSLSLLGAGGGSADGGKITSQKGGWLPIPQVPIRFTNAWYGKTDGIVDPLPSKEIWIERIIDKKKEVRGRLRILI